MLPSKKLVGEKDFLKQLQTYDKDNMEAKLIDRIQ